MPKEEVRICYDLYFIIYMINVRNEHMINGVNCRESQCSTDFNRIGDLLCQVTVSDKAIHTCVELHSAKVHHESATRGHDTANTQVGKGDSACIRGSCAMVGGLPRAAARALEWPEPATARGFKRGSSQAPLQCGIQAR